MPVFKDLSGLTFNSWKVVEVHSKIPHSMWKCLCLRCGSKETKIIRGSNLVSGSSKSCCNPGNYKGMILGRQRSADLRGTPSCNCSGPRTGNYRLCTKHSELWKIYRLTPIDYQNLIDNQTGLCGICTIPMNPVRGTNVDHCHSTGKVRMLLCTLCNITLGAVRDKQWLLDAAKDYLERFGSNA